MAKDQDRPDRGDTEEQRPEPPRVKPSLAGANYANTEEQQTAEHRTAWRELDEAGENIPAETADRIERERDETL